MEQDLNVYRGRYSKEKAIKDMKDKGLLLLLGVLFVMVSCLTQ